MYSELGGGENRSLSHHGAGRMWDVNEREDPGMTLRFGPERLKRGSYHQLPWRGLTAGRR